MDSHGSPVFGLNNLSRKPIQKRSGHMTHMGDRLDYADKVGIRDQMRGHGSLSMEDNQSAVVGETEPAPTIAVVAATTTTANTASSSSVTTGGIQTGDMSSREHYDRHAQIAASTVEDFINYSGGLGQGVAVHTDQSMGQRWKKSGPSQEACHNIPIAGFTNSGRDLGENLGENPQTTSIAGGGANCGHSGQQSLNISDGHLYQHQQQHHHQTHQSHHHQQHTHHSQSQPGFYQQNAGQPSRYPSVSSMLGSLDQPRANSYMSNRDIGQNENEIFHLQHQTLNELADFKHQITTAFNDGIVRILDKFTDMQKGMDVLSGRLDRIELFLRIPHEEPRQQIKSPQFTRSMCPTLVFLLKILTYENPFMSGGDFLLSFESDSCPTHNWCINHKTLENARKEVDTYFSVYREENSINHARFNKINTIANSIRSNAKYDAGRAFAIHFRAMDGNQIPGGIDNQGIDPAGESDGEDSGQLRKDIDAVQRSHGSDFLENWHKDPAYQRSLQTWLEFCKLTITPVREACFRFYVKLLLMHRNFSIDSDPQKSLFREILQRVQMHD